MEASALSAPAALSRGSGASPWLRLRSDEQLVGLFRSGSEEAFRVIHDRYRQRLFGYARQMLGGSGSDAEDVMQDVFLRAYRALRVDARPVSLRAWLYRVAHNRCIDHLRRPVPAPSEIFEMSRTPEHDPFDAAERREDLARLVADVRRLPEQQRSALLMREMDGMSYADLAAALETSVPAVKSLLVRARIGLVEAIEARDTDCADIRHDLAASYDKGVRASGRARRHLRDCDGCTTYRAQLRSVRQGFAALSPGGVEAGLLAKLLGLGGATSGGAAAAGGAASGTAATIGGGAAAVSVTKVAAVMCCAAALTGGAVEVKKIVATHSAGSARQQAERAAGAATVAPATTHVIPAIRSVAGATPELRRAAPVLDGRSEDLALHPPIPIGPSLDGVRDNGNGSGGQLAPAESNAVATPTPKAAPAAEEDEESDGALPVTEDVLPLPGDDEATDGEPTTGAGTGDETTSGGTSSSSTSTGGTTSGSTTSSSGSSTSGSSTTGSTSSASGSGSGPAPSRS